MSLTCHPVIASLLLLLVSVRSIIELCPREFMNVGEVPLFAQDRPVVLMKSRSCSPLLLLSLFPHSLCLALVSVPIIRGSLCLSV